MQSNVFGAVTALRKYCLVTRPEAMKAFNDFWMQISGQCHAPTVLLQGNRNMDILQRGGCVGTKTGLGMALREKKTPCPESEPIDPPYTRI
jgi:hypothetical protein